MNHKFNTLSSNETDCNFDTNSINISGKNVNIHTLSEEEKEIFDTINSNLDTHIEEVDMYNNFIDLGVDSISFIMLVIVLETKYKFEFDDEMLILDNIANMKKMIDYVCSKINRNNTEMEL